MGAQQPASHPPEDAKHEPAEPAPAKTQAASPGASRVRKYKLLMVIPLLLILGSLGVLVSQYATTGEWVQRSIELKGGTVITLAGTADAAAAEAALPGANARTLRGFSGSSLLIELGPEADAQASLAALAAAGLPTATSSVQTIGPSLGASFWQQTLIGLVAAFALMGIVVFFLFKNPVTSGYVILSVVADIVVTLAAMQLLGIELTLAGLAALLLLIGYSVDTDILLTSRLTKRAGALAENLSGAFRTGITMSAATLAALAALLLSGASAVLSTIAIVLFIGILADILNTWVTNAGLLVWYLHRKVVS